MEKFFFCIIKFINDIREKSHNQIRFTIANSLLLAGSQKTVKRFRTVT